jgi:hypothetical protein
VTFAHRRALQKAQTQRLSCDVFPFLLDEGRQGHNRCERYRGIFNTGGLYVALGTPSGFWHGMGQAGQGLMGGRSVAATSGNGFLSLYLGHDDECSFNF